jgi:ADP-heptose:LPS heptosyltransferase
LAREIGSQAFVIGIKNSKRWFAPWDNSAYSKLDASFAPFHQPKHGYHITDVYADWFHQLCGLQVTEQQRFPFVDIPAKWKDGALRQLQEWNADDQQVVFINAYAKTKKRCWPLARVAELIINMRKQPAWGNTHFVVNAIPQEIGNAKTVIANYQLTNTHLFSAEENFFQLPAMLQRCQLVISVETAVMHLANAVQVPVIALMRQKNPEWVPIDKQSSTVITTKRRRDWVDAITVNQISEALPQ